MELLMKAWEASGGLERAVLFLLIAFSIIGWAIIIQRYRRIKAIKENNTRFIEAFDAADTFDRAQRDTASIAPSTLGTAFRAALTTLEESEDDAPPTGKPSAGAISTTPKHGIEAKVSHAMAQAVKKDFNELNYGLGFLASVGSASPFIGLFGTIWGIMHTFQIMGTEKSTSLNTIAPPIAAALIATAAGLAVAIPAVMAYNWFLGQIDLFQEKADLFERRILLLVEASGFTKDGAVTVAAPAPAPRAARAPQQVQAPVQVEEEPEAEAEAPAEEEGEEAPPPVTKTTVKQAPKPAAATTVKRPQPAARREE